MVEKLFKFNSKSSILTKKREISDFLFSKAVLYRHVAKASKRLFNNNSHNRLTNCQNITQLYYKYYGSLLEYGQRSSNLFKGFNSLNSYSSCSKNQKESGTTPPRKPLSSSLNKLLNQQIFEEIQASYMYLSMACYFARTEVALPGCYTYYKKLYKEELAHADLLIEYLTMRGGKVELHPVQPPNNQEWSGIEDTLGKSIKLEQTIKDKLENIYHCAEKEGDFGLSDLIQGEFLREQDIALNELSRLLVRYIKMAKTGCGCGCGEFLFDRELFAIFGKMETNSKSQGHETPKDSYL